MQVRGQIRILLTGSLTEANPSLPQLIKLRDLELLHLVGRSTSCSNLCSYKLRTEKRVFKVKFKVTGQAACLQPRWIPSTDEREEFDWKMFLKFWFKLFRYCQVLYMQAQLYYISSLPSHNDGTVSQGCQIKAKMSSHILKSKEIGL